MESQQGQSNNLYKIIFENSSAAMAVVEYDISISMVNDAFCLLTGYKKEELTGMNWTKNMPQKEVDRVKKINRSRHSNSENIPKEYETVINRKNGEHRHCLISGVVIEEKKKTLITIIDITDIKHVKETLTEQNYLIEESHKAANIGSYKVNLLDGSWESSEILDKILGLNENYERKVVAGWDNIIHPDDRDFIARYMEKEVIGQHKPFNEEYRIIRKSDGRTRWVNGLGKVFVDENGQAVSLIGTIHDITDRKLSEQIVKENQTKLEIALKVAHLGPWEYDVKEDLFRFNDVFYALFKTSSAEVGGNVMTSKQYAQKFLHPDDFKVVVFEIRKALESKEEKYIRQMEHRIIYADGTEGYIVVIFTAIKNDKGEAVKLFGINQDITERRRVEEELRTSEKKLLELNATKDKFFSIVAHDLRNPVSSIVGLSEILTDYATEMKSERMIKLTEGVYRSSLRMMDLLTNLMEWSRAETGRMEFSPKNIKLNVLSGEIFELLTPAVSQKSITLISRIPADFVVYADRAMLSTVLRNLVSNAVKFSYENGTVVLSAKVSNGEAVIQVKDSGVGISDVQKDKLFRLDKNYTTPGTKNEKGTGLGLILCREFVEKHGGKIGLESKVGEGTVFYFTLPDENKF